MFLGCVFVRPSFPLSVNTYFAHATRLCVLTWRDFNETWHKYRLREYTDAAKSFQWHKVEVTEAFAGTGISIVNSLLKTIIFYNNIQLSVASVKWTV